MQADKQVTEVRAEQKAQAPVRQFLRLSDIDRNGLDDLQGMFGLWKEADHCDRDVVANDVAPLRATA